jgi:hypothetical protein
MFFKLKNALRYDHSSYGVENQFMNGIASIYIIVFDLMA